MTFKKCNKCINSFSCFFRHATPTEKEEVFMEVARQASANQQDMVKKYYRLASEPTPAQKKTIKEAKKIMKILQSVTKVIKKQKG